MHEEELAVVRRAYAKQVLAQADVNDARLEDCLAQVRREDFLGPGPWQMLVGLKPDYRLTPSDDPVYLYQDTLFGIMTEKGLNNGQPSFLARLISFGRLREGEHAVHIGCGVGYYTAMVARLVGNSGSVTAIEFEPPVATRAKANLAPYHNVRVVEGDGSTIPLDPADSILVNAGACRPAAVWLDAMKEGGRLLLPLTAKEWGGAIFLIERKQDAFHARVVAPTYIFPCAGLREPEEEAAIAEAFKKGRAKEVTRLYRSDDIPEERCWLRGRGWALAFS